MMLLRYFIVSCLLIPTITMSQDDPTRNFRMGVAGLVPKNDETTQDAFNDLYEKIPDFGELFGVHSTHYSEIHQFTSDSIPVPFFITFEAVQGVTNYAAVGLKPWGGMDQNDIDNYLQDHQTHFKHVVTTVAADYQPEFLVIGIEVNHHVYRASTQFWDDFVVVYEQLYDEIKADYPNINIGTNFFIEDMKGALIAYPTSNWELIAEIENKSDFVSFTTFPYVSYNHPNDIPANYYEEINDYVSLPVLITETGWPTQPVTEPDLPDLSADEATQVEYIKTLIDRTCPINNLEAIIWAFPHDATFSEDTDIFNYISLRRIDGSAKPGFDLWNDILQFDIDQSNTICEINLSASEYEKEDFIIFPNPANDKVQINSSKKLEYTVYNSLGQSVKNGKLDHSNPVISIQELEKGVYTIEIIDMSLLQKSVSKLIKQ